MKGKVTDTSDIGPTSGYIPKPITTLGWWASGLFGLAGLMSVLSAVVFVYHFYLVNQAGVQYAIRNWGGIYPASWYSFKLFVYSSILVLFFLVTGFIVYIFWLYRAAANVHAIRLDAITISPGWAVAWNFVPIAFFWMPYVAVKQIWQTSRNIQYPDQVPVPGTLRWWWGFWLVTMILNWTVEFDESELAFMEMPKDDVMLLITLYSALAAACFFQFKIIREITRAQATLASNTAGIFE